MDEPERSTPARAPAPVVPTASAASWALALPPPPFVDPASPPGRWRFSALSPRVAVLVGVAILVAWLFW
ncbi:MAG: hypothetical protein ABIQ58_08460, partial [Candidatus Limnocylindrales bacterium]